MFVGVIQSSRLTHGFRRVVQLCQLTPLTVRLSSSSCNGPQPMSRFGTERTALAREVALLMDALPQPPPYFLDNGTLLGLWREGALINSWPCVLGVSGSATSRMCRKMAAFGWLAFAVYFDASEVCW